MLQLHITNGILLPAGQARLQGLHSPKSVALRAHSHASLHHIFLVAGTLRVPLSQPQKRRIQPERYRPLTLARSFCCRASFFDNSLKDT